MAQPSQPVPPSRETTLWEGQSQTLTSLASGGRMTGGRYRLTDHHLYVSTGMLRNNEQQIPLAHVQDVDVKQSITQKARGVGNVIVHVTRPDGVRDTLTMELVESPAKVRDAVNASAYEARQRETRMANTQQVHYTGAPTVAAPTAANSAEMFEQLRQLGQLRDAGVVSPAEFEAKKAELLTRI